MWILICSRSKHDSEFKAFQSTREIEEKASKYVDQYLNTSYISIMFRSEHMIGKIKDDKAREELIETCVNKVISRVQDLKIKTGIDSVFLSLDIGRHGSHDHSNTSKKTSLMIVRDTIKDLVPRATNDQISLHRLGEQF